jgi:hypothetical protein
MIPRKSLIYEALKIIENTDSTLCGEELSLKCCRKIKELEYIAKKESDTKIEII